MNLKTVLFARVSTREQAEEGYSLPAQEKLLNEYALKNDLLIIKKFSIPESASGKQERTLFNQLLNYLEEHPNISTVICEKVDRITRNFKDAVRLDDWLTEKEERQIHFVKQNLIIHKNSRSHEKFQWDIYLALARQYSNNLSEETRKGLTEKAEEGWFPGNHKRGYKTIGEAGHKIWVIDDEKPDAKYMEMAFVMFNTGNFTLRTLSQELFKQGWSLNGKPISRSELHLFLRDPFYCGEFIWHGKLYKGKHKSLVSKELFESVQQLLRRKIKAGKYDKHDFLFGGGLMVCGECGRTITWETQKGQSYGHCTKHGTNCSQRKYVKQEEVEKQVVDIFDKFVIKNQRLLEWVRKALKESHQNEDEYHITTIKELDAKILQLEKRLSILYDDRVDGRIDKTFYELKRQQYEEELNVVIDAKERHVKANINYMELGMNLFELSQKGRKIYENMALNNEKKELMNFAFSNLKLKDKKVYPSFKNGFEIIAKRSEDGNWLRDLDSNQDYLIQSQASYH